MVKFSTMGELQYIEKYKIDKSNHLISEFVAVIKNIKDKYFNVLISAQRYIENDNEFYDTSVQLTDIDKKFVKIEFKTRYIMRLDHYMDHIDKLYRTKVKNETVILDYNTYTWYNSTTKAENDYRLRLGTIRTNGSLEDDDNSVLYITVDKANGVTKCGNDFTIKPISVENETVIFENKPPVEIFTLTDVGLVHFLDQQILHDYYDKSGVFWNVKYHELYIPENNFLSNIHPICMLHNKMTITDLSGHSETFDIEYDEYGIYVDSTFKDSSYKLPVIFERYVNEDEEFQEENSLHPVHIDHSNLHINHHEGLYALDRFILNDDYSHDYDKFAEFIREVRKLNDDEMNYISIELDEHICDDPPILYVENFESIVDEILQK